MKKDTFLSIARLVDDDPLTESQIRELTGADKDDVISSERAAQMLGVKVDQLRRMKDLPRLRTNNRHLQYRLIDVRAYRDRHCW